MPLIVIETGEIVEGANSFVSVDDYRLYFSDIGIDTSSSSDMEISERLVVAFRAMDSLYWGRLQGQKVQASQEGMFPRRNMINIETGETLESNYIPRNVKYWQIEAAKILFNKGIETLEPMLENVGGVKSYTSTVDVLTESVTFATSGRFDVQIFTRLENLMRPFLKHAAIINMPIVGKYA